MDIIICLAAAAIIFLFAVPKLQSVMYRKSRPTWKSEELQSRWCTDTDSTTENAALKISGHKIQYQNICGRSGELNYTLPNNIKEETIYYNDGHMGSLNNAEVHAFPVGDVYLQLSDYSVFKSICFREEKENGIRTPVLLASVLAQEASGFTTVRFRLSKEGRS